MVEPDNVMDGPLWPSGWQTGWVSWVIADLTGNPIEGSVTIEMTVARAVIPGQHVTISNVPLVIPLEGGRPGGTRVVGNTTGVPVIELPLSRDGEVSPFPVVYRLTESWGEKRSYLFEVSAENTFDDPLWLSGDLGGVIGMPGVTSRRLWDVPVEESGPPLDAAVGDWVLYRDTATIKEITAL